MKSFSSHSDLGDESTIVEVDHSNNAGTETTDMAANSDLDTPTREGSLKKTRGWPKGVPRAGRQPVNPKQPPHGKKKRKKWKRTVIIPKKVWILGW